jgi:hypothetical protein
MICATLDYQIEINYISMARKILTGIVRHAIKNEGLTNPGFCATMNMLQADALPIGGSKC